MSSMCAFLKRGLQPVVVLQIILLSATKLFLVSAQDHEHSTSDKLDILYAVNCGGSEHVDHFGVPYRADTNPDGIASDYGLRWQLITNTHPDDFVLYQTERYAESTFGYDIPLPKSQTAQNYVLVLKFAEVYFNQPGMKVFDVLLNGDHLIVDGLDIFERAGGRAAAYDIHIPFRITGNKLFLINTGEESDFSGTLRIDFVKTSQDNPKCNAFYVARGTLNDIPKQEIRKSILEMENERDKESDLKDPSNSRDYSSDETSWTIPDFPTPGADLEDDLGLERYYPVIAVFLFIAVLTIFLFKL